MNRSHSFLSTLPGTRSGTFSSAISATLIAGLLVAVATITYAGQSDSDTPPSSPEASMRDEALQAPSPIAAESSPWIEELTWMEIRDRIAEGYTTVIVPTGGIEENGPYLATGKHNLILEASCPIIASKLGNALCAPIVKFVPQGDIDPPSGAMVFPGTISLRESTYEALLTDIAASLRQTGFLHIVFIGDSGGNQSGMARVANALNNEWEDARAHFVREFYDPGWEATEEFTRQELRVDETRNDGYHDDIWVTAMMAVVDPQQIRFEQRVQAGRASINGVALEPLESTVALGEAMIEFRATFTADAIRKAIAREAAP